MKPENKAFLDANRHHHDTLVRAFYLRGLNAHEREGMQRVMSEEFQPGYTADLWCPPCVSEMVLRLYRCYDEWLAQNTGPTHDAALPEEIIEPLSQAKPVEPFDEPIQVAANFPSHAEDKQTAAPVNNQNHSRNKHRRR